MLIETQDRINGIPGVSCKKASRPPNQQIASRGKQATVGESMTVERHLTMYDLKREESSLLV